MEFYLAFISGCQWIYRNIFAKVLTNHPAISIDRDSSEIEHVFTVNHECCLIFSTNRYNS